MLRLLIILATAFAFISPVSAQVLAPNSGGDIDRSLTGGATTLDDILLRQEGMRVDDAYRRDNKGSVAGADSTQQLGTLGGASDAEIFRAIRHGTADITTSSRGPASDVVIQDAGTRWMHLRTGSLNTYGAYVMIGTFLLLCVFYLIRGKIMIEGPITGKTIERFKGFERFGHWLFAGSFIILGATGMMLLFGRNGLIPFIGHDAYAAMAIKAKWIHNNLSWAFMLGLIIITVNWISHNIPNRLDLAWLAKAGGLFSKGVHPPAKKFNAGQKVIFWSCILLGLSISATGLSLLFPFQINLFGPVFAFLNDIGMQQLFGIVDLPAAIPPQEEMQLAQIWHVVNAFIFIAIITAHIYLGSVGMQGAYSAMGSGDVELQWAREHHSLWVKEVEAAAQGAGASTDTTADASTDTTADANTKAD
jgi:formate dehydrogenase subunit gamma